MTSFGLKKSSLFVSIFIVLSLLLRASTTAANEEQAEKEGKDAGKEEKESEECSQSWPAGVPTADECCNLPAIFDHATTFECTAECGARPKQRTSVCVAECYVRRTGILVDGKLNKAAILAAARLDFARDPWAEVVNATLDACAGAMEDGADVNAQLTSLLACTRRAAATDCIEFKSMESCTRAERFYERCRRPKPTCDAWPRRLTNTTITGCCNAPKLVDTATSDSCKVACTFAVDNWRCMSRCLFANSALVSDTDGLNVTAVKAALGRNRDASVDWRDVIDTSVDRCLKLYKEKFLVTNFTDVSLLNGLDYCITWQMSARCMDFNEIGYGSGCYDFRRFRELCPDVVPSGPF